MNIRHECPMPELSFSVTAPLHLHKENGCKLTAQRWSLTGLWLDDPNTDIAGDTFVSVPFQGVDVSFPVTLVATDEPGRYTFSKLTVRQRETLATFHQGVLSGKMASTQDMITSLDTPIDLVPMGETDEEKSEGLTKAKPRLLRILWNVIFYLVLAVFLVGFVGGNIWQRLSYVTLDHGRFIAPVQEYRAPEGGYVDRIYVAVGDKVRAGDALARIEDPDRESDVEEVRTEVLLAEKRLADAEERLARHVKRRDFYRASLWHNLHQAWLPWWATRPLTNDYPLALVSAWEAFNNFEQGRDQAPGGYHDILADLQSRVDELDLDRRRWKRELRHRKSAADELIVRAKTAGTVFAMHTINGSFVADNDLVVEIEEDVPRLAVGWLDDDLATVVSVGMIAEIKYVFRGQSKRVLGEVIDVEAGTNIAQPDKFGMVVTIKADNAGLQKTRKWFRRNAPARIRLKRTPLSWIWEGSDNEGA